MTEITLTGPTGEEMRISVSTGEHPQDRDPWPRRLAVWWVPQIPCPQFIVEVETPREAKLLLDVLAQYDLHQYRTKIKPDYTNIGGVQEEINGDWWDVDTDDPVWENLE